MVRLRTEEPDLDDAGLLWRWLPEPRYVFLRRDDNIRRAVSQYRAISSGVWWSRGKGRRRRLSAHVPIDPEAIDKLFWQGARQEQAWLDFFARVGVVPLTLTYEEVEADLGQAVAQVLRHVDVDPVRAPPVPAPKLIRQADAWTEEAVHRYVTWRRVHAPMESWQYGFDGAR